MAYGAYTEEKIEERIEEMTPKNKKMDIVYFFLCDGFIKIGKVNPNDDEDVADPGNEKKVLSRLSGCKTGNPKQIYLLGYLIGEETYWHRVLHEHRHQGEWYSYDGIKGILFNLRLQHSNVFLEKWRQETVYVLEKKLEKVNYFLNQYQREEEYKNIKKEIKDIKKYTWDQYVRKVCDISFRDIESDIIEHRFQKSKSSFQLEINNTKNYSYKNWQAICDGLGLMFRTNVEYKEKRKNSIIDEMHDVIHEGEMYYHLNLYSNCAHGLTLRNAVFLYKNMHPDIKKLAIDKREKEEIKTREAMNNMYTPKKKLEEKTL